MNDISPPTVESEASMKPERCAYKIDPRFEAALALVDRRIFLDNQTQGRVVGRSIPSTENLVKILGVVTQLPTRPRILHIGAGLGYATAVLARLAHGVVAIEKNQIGRAHV